MNVQTVFDKVKKYFIDIQEPTFSRTYKINVNTNKRITTCLSIKLNGKLRKFPYFLIDFDGQEHRLNLDTHINPILFKELDTLLNLIKMICENDNKKHYYLDIEHEIFKET